MRVLVNAATNSPIALRTLVSAEIHRYAERPQLPRSALSTPQITGGRVSRITRRRTHSSPIRAHSSLASFELLRLSLQLQGRTFGAPSRPAAPVSRSIRGTCTENSNQQGLRAVAARG